MELKSFEIWNFKSIKNSEKILLPKLMILIGPNNSGKSSIIQSLLLMKQTLETDDPSYPLVLNGPYVKLGEYKDLIYGQKYSNNFKIKFNFKVPPKNKPFHCFLCEKKYQEKTWLIKHLKSKHKFFWENYRYDVPLEQYASYASPSVKLTFSYDQENKDIIIKELEIENPAKIDGLFLSSLKFIQMKNKKIKIEAFSFNRIKIFSKVLRFLEVYPFRESEFIDINSIYGSFRAFQFFQYYQKGLKNEKEKILMLEKNVGNSLKLDLIDNLRRSKYYRYASPSRKFPEKFNLTEDQKIALSILGRIGALTYNISNYLMAIKNYLGSFGHLGPLRTTPERIYFGTGGKPTSVGDEGQFTPELLWRDKRINHAKLISRINNWMEKLKLNCEVELYSIDVGEMYQLKIKQNNLSVNITDVGVGISQILPILTECVNFALKQPRPRYFYRYYNPHLYSTEQIEKTLSIEQPEIHLNPAIQAELGDFFIQFINSKLNLIIETHSEHILSRIQRRIVDKTIKNHNDVVIYYISKRNRKSSEIKKITISKDGVFSYWPDGFFQDDYDDALHIIEESLKNQMEY